MFPAKELMGVAWMACEASLCVHTTRVAQCSSSLSGFVFFIGYVMMYLVAANIRHMYVLFVKNNKLTSE